MRARVTEAVISNSSPRRILACLALLVAVPAIAAEPPIDPGVAALYVGRDVIVEGTVTHAERDAWVVRLRLGEPPGDLAVQLVLGMLSRFPDNPESYYLGKRIRVLGRVGEFRDRTEMIVRDPDRILVVDMKADRTSEEVLRLEKRVRELEERLQTLEQSDAEAPAPTPSLESTP